MYFNLFTYAFLIATFSHMLTLFWLNYRQKNSIKASFTKVPQEFSKQISLTEHQKAAKYTKAKLKLANIEIILSVIILLIWTIAGGVNYLDVLWQDKFDNQIYSGVSFIISFMLISSIVDIPLSIYRTFVLEAKFGFNKTNVKTFIADSLKGLLLSLIIGVPLIYVILYLMAEMGEFWWLYVWLTLTAFSLLMLWIYPNYIAPIFNKFNALDNIELKNKIDNLLQRTGFNSDGVFVMDGSKRSSHGNAYFTGIGKNKRIVFFDTLLKGMEDEEVEAILAHELGHFHHKHVRKRIITSFLSTLIALALLGFLIDKTWFFNGLGVMHESNHSALILFSLIIPVFSFFISPISNYLSRKHEFEADAFAAKHTSSKDLISSLVKLYRDNAATLTPDNVYSAFHDSHPSAAIRINQLKTFAK